MIEPYRLGAKEAAGRIERGELSAQRLVQSCLERIAEREPAVQAWAFLAQEIVYGESAPLRGVPGERNRVGPCPRRYGRTTRAPRAVSSGTTSS